MATPSGQEGSALAEDCRDRIEDALLSLDQRWLVLGDLQLGEPPGEARADFVLLHPERGIALVEAGAESGPDPVAPFRELLAAEGFARFFPGELPIIHLRVGAEDAAAIEDRLAEAFAAAPP